MLILYYSENLDLCNTLENSNFAIIKYLVKKSYMNVWSTILAWFKERSERNEFLNQFNESAKMAFVSGQTDTFLRASVSFGNSGYRHAFSKLFGGGFRIKAEAGGTLTRDDVMAIGKTIINDPVIVRLMITLGWDTLEVYPSGSSQGIQWKLFNQHLIS